MTSAPVSRNHSLDEEELHNHGTTRGLDLEHKFPEVGSTDWIESSSTELKQGGNFQIKFIFITLSALIVFKIFTIEEF